MKKNFLPLLLLFLNLTVAFSQPKQGYYDQAVGKTGAELKTTLYSIISSGFVSKSYDFLYTIYETSDVTPEGYVWDMYSDCTWVPGQKKCGNYSKVCDCYNREHSIPQSWFDSRSPMVSDAFHVYPTDGKVNGQRSNFPFGECSGGTTLSGGRGRLGNSTFTGYSGTVFEPDDEYKGDFARTYFYFATRYQNIMTSIGGESFNKTTYPALSDWAKALFLKWHRQDPVSKKETDRNNAVEVYQKNRNPFIDHPELAEYVWGLKVGEPWSLSSGIENLKIEFSISPVPAKDFLNIKTNEYNLMCRIFNIQGQELMKTAIDGNISLPISDLNNGMYLLQLEKEGEKTIQKFVVSR
ncbi:MAG: endonuclease [Paludibacteraceae bacterium]|nr:endonuclease [Paludibacteraceae bacterium]